jgi:DNA-binding response OmpR family regulator
MPGPTSTIRVLVIEDDPKLRDGLAALLVWDRM